MQLSHSRVETFIKCPYQYKLRYIDKLKMLPKYDPADPLIVGTALHKGIETDAKIAVEEYLNSYPVITDAHIEEAMKLEYWFPKIQQQLPQGGLHEIQISDDDFIGFIDYLVPLSSYFPDDPDFEYKEGDIQYFDLYDFKYSNNVRNYLESDQLHLYKYYFEKLNPDKKIRDMYFMFVPKSALRMKRKNKTNPRDETISEFRKRIKADLDSKEIQFVKIKYNPNKVIEFLTNGKHTVEADVYDKNPTRLCDWCDYQGYCEKGEDLDMALPSTQRRTIEGNSFKKIWLYGAPFSGKTYLANKFDIPLMLNTDGNFKQVDAPVLRIVDEVKTEGRITTRKYAWEVFKEAIDDLEKGSEFKTIIVDLLEDVYDACRVKVCVDNGWDHESDDSFKAYDIVRSEFLRTMKRLLNLDYNIILISHEDTSKDITKRTGDKITKIAPNLNEKIALKMAGMVDLVARVVKDGDTRTLSFKTSDVIFGGGRLAITALDIPCEYEELMKVYAAEPVAKTRVATPAPAPVETATAAPTEVETRTRSRRTRTEEPEEEACENTQETEEAQTERESEEPTVTETAEATTEETTEEAPTPRRRRRV